MVGGSAFAPSTRGPTQTIRRRGICATRAFAPATRSTSSSAPVTPETADEDAAGARARARSKDRARVPPYERQAEPRRDGVLRPEALVHEHGHVSPRWRALRGVGRGAARRAGHAR